MSWRPTTTPMMQRALKLAAERPIHNGDMSKRTFTLGTVAAMHRRGWLEYDSLGFVWNLTEKGQAAAASLSVSNTEEGT